ncbi:MAG TPA: protein kinase, partial [Gemmatimonadaceae bacterium]|nr:protein kinase [Gemmatimonadaceae bacterium]
MSSLLRDRLAQATSGRYVVDEEIGRGGMAAVFGATDVRLKRAVAIKALPPDLAFRADVRSRFIREAQMAAGLAHPHIVPIYAVEETEGLVWMVMGRVRGESLAQRLHRDGQQSFSETRRVLRETADALDHAHTRGVIHRDVKPDNILIDQASGRVMVTDFGIARAMEGDQRLTATGVAVGTPTYMSPEQARGDDIVDGRADVYALGVVGYQMLTGAPPFIAPNTPALLLKHVSESPAPLHSKRRDTPLNLEYAIERALAKDPAVRWQSASAFRDGLADDAHTPAGAKGGEWGFNVRVGVIAQKRADAPPSSADHGGVPPYPVWRGGGRDERAAWREAKLAWREQVRAQESMVATSARAAKEAARAARRASHHRGKNAPIGDKIRGFQKHFVSNVLVGFMLFAINALTGGFPWFIFPALAMSIGILIHALSLWQDGARVRDLFTSPARLNALHPPVAVVSDPGLAVEDRARSLVSSDVLSGSHGSVVRRAVDDERAVLEILASLAPADRAQLPDVEPTLRSLIDRVASLAQSVHRLDADVHPGQLSQIDSRLAEARAQAATSTDGERRVSLLERQRSTLAELAERRQTLASQLESVSLVLHTMRLDLLRLRSSGIAAASGEGTNITQEARALSNEIGRVLDAAAEVRK